MAYIINSAEIDRLATIIEEGARATAGAERFIEPAPDTLRRAIAKRHHLIFGRRGSGKTSFLSKAAFDLSNEGCPVAFIDLEPFKGNYYPDVLLSVLIQSLSEFQKWLGKKPSVYYRIFKFFDLQKENASKRKLSLDIQKLLDELESLLHSADNAELEVSKSKSEERAAKGSAKAGVEVAQVFGVSTEVSELDKKHQGTQLKETFTRSKIDFLNRKILEFREIFKTLAEVSNKDSFLFLDDLYHIRKQDQAQLLDYFHRIAKGTKLWLKVGTIQRRSQWYRHGDPPVGIKIADDAEGIDLDVTLETYSVARDFLLKILNGFVKESGAPEIYNFTADGALERLVLASGGVARDFLSIFRRSIQATRERLLKDPGYYRGPKIGAEDVNTAVGTYGEVKREEFERDSLEDKEKLETAFGKVVDFCIEQANSNCFLLDQTLENQETELINELVDLRLIHLVKSRVTVKSSKVGKAYRAYMLDLSQYVGSRVKRDLKIIKFWSSPDDLRRASLIYM